MIPQPKLKVFAVFEPAYKAGCIAMLSSLTRLATKPVAVDLVTRPNYIKQARAVVSLIKNRYHDKISICIIEVPDWVIQDCSKHKFQGHFIPEVLFRLYYFNIAPIDHRYIIHVDIDMIFCRDIYEIEPLINDHDLLYVVRSDMPARSKQIMPDECITYINAGFMVFNTSPPEKLLTLLQRTRDIVDKISTESVYLDQDAINIAFYNDMKFLPQEWNYTLSCHEHKITKDNVAILHATGSRKPWFIFGKHPFTQNYLSEMNLLNIPFLATYDFFWFFRKVLKYFHRAINK